MDEHAEQIIEAIYFILDNGNDVIIRKGPKGTKKLKILSDKKELVKEIEMEEISHIKI